MNELLQFLLGVRNRRRLSHKELWLVVSQDGVWRLSALFLWLNVWQSLMFDNIVTTICLTKNTLKMSDFINKVCSPKHTYVAPAMQVVRLEAQRLLANSFSDANDPTGSGEDFPWESAMSEPFNLHK